MKLLKDPMLEQAITLIDFSNVIHLVLFEKQANVHSPPIINLPCN